MVVETTEAEALLVSLERVLQYVTLPQESFELPGTGSAGNAAGDVALLPSPPPAWPSAGEVEFRGIRLRYRPGLPAALDDFSLRAEPYQRVGIVGRPGAGKSTVAAALFRLVQPEAGAILVDGVDILRLGLLVHWVFSVLPCSVDLSRSDFDVFCSSHAETSHFCVNSARVPQR